MKISDFRDRMDGITYKLKAVSSIFTIAETDRSFFSDTNAITGYYFIMQDIIKEITDLNDNIDLN